MEPDLPSLPAAAEGGGALDWVRATARADGLVVTEQPTLVPRWVRGNESAWLTAPRLKKLHFVGLGMSVGTSGAD